WERVLRDGLVRPARDGRAPEPRTPRIDVLLALRRVQGRPDPIGIDIDLPPVVELPFPELPHFTAALTNRDVEQMSCTFRLGGDYRGGRLARWRFDVRDPDGRALPDRYWARSMGGGFQSSDTLGPGESWSTHLDMASYVEPAAIPLLRFRVLYHDTLAIADADEEPLEGLIVASSAEQTLVWTPRRVVVGAEDRALADARFAALDPEALVWIADAPFPDPERRRPGAPPDARGVWLYRMGERALPTLLAALRDPLLSAERRAWVLALLYDVTGCLDPRVEFGVLGTHESLYVGPPEPGEVSASTSHQLVCWPIDVPLQMQFAARWERFAPLFEFVDAE
ncbi:MAG TPA: hypothetical protein VJP77_00920, partial [Planctomycetota bacterium]|nr:hypothetical protein [Planctomycetota bacterium]